MLSMKNSVCKVSKLKEITLYYTNHRSFNLALVHSTQNPKTPKPQNPVSQLYSSYKILLD